MAAIRFEGYDEQQDRQDECPDCHGACAGWLAGWPCTIPRVADAEPLEYQTVNHHRVRWYSEMLRETVLSGVMSLEKAEAYAAQAYGSVEDLVTVKRPEQELAEVI